MKAVIQRKAIERPPVPTAEGLVADVVGLLRSARRISMSVHAESRSGIPKSFREWNFDLDWERPDRLRLHVVDGKPALLVCADGKAVLHLEEPNRRYEKTVDTSTGLGCLKVMEDSSWSTILPEVNCLFALPLEEAGWKKILAASKVELVGLVNSPPNSYHIRFKRPDGEMNWFVAASGRPLLLRADWRSNGAVVPLNLNRAPSAEDQAVRFSETYEIREFEPGDRPAGPVSPEFLWVDPIGVTLGGSPAELVQTPEFRDGGEVWLNLPAPVLDLPTTDGVRFRLADWKGKQFVVLYFFSPAAPIQNEIWKRLQDTSVRKWLSLGTTFFPIAVGLPQNKVGTLRELTGIQGRLVLDADGAAARAIKLSALPTAMIVDRDGYVRRVHQGFPLHWEGLLDREIEALVAAEKRRAEVLGSINADLSLDRLIELTSHDDSAVQTRAIPFLIRRCEKDPAALKVVAEGLRSIRPAIRGNAATILGGCGKTGEPYYSNLADLLVDPDPVVRGRAELALVKLAGLVVPTLIDRLETGERADLKARIFDILFQFVWTPGSQRLAECAIQALHILENEQDPAARTAAKKFLAKQRRGVGDELKEALESPVLMLHQGAVEVLVDMGPTGTSLMLESLAVSPAVHLDRLGVWAADKLPPSDAVRIREVLRSRDLQRSVGGAPAAELIPLLADTNYQAALRVSDMLAARKKEAVPELTKALTDERGQVRRLSARALGLIGPEADPALAALLELSDDRLTEIRKEAARAIGRLGPQVTKTLVERLAKAKSSTDRLLVLRAAAEMEQGGAELVPGILELLKVPNQSKLVRDEAVRALRTVAKSSPQPLLAALGSGDAEWGRMLPQVFDIYGEAAVAPLVQQLQDNRWEVRMNAASALGAVGKAAAPASDALQAALDDSNESVRFYAREALRKINAP